MPFFTLDCSEPIYSSPQVQLSLVMEGSKYKVFLDESWTSQMSRKQATLHPFGNTPAKDYLHNLDLGTDLEILMIGSGMF